MKKWSLYVIGLIFSLSSVLKVYSQNRTEIEIPDILGYETLKYDLHMYTVFSDGDVWPTVRVQEAWQEGLDAIAITDHIEYLPHSQDIEANHNRGYEIAEPLANQFGLLLIHGTEITRQMAPGYLTALFIKNANLIEREDWWDAVNEAKDQGAFIFWSNPGREDLVTGQVQWSEEHTSLYEGGMLNGIEIYSEDELYSETIRWAADKNLTILGNSDLHDPVTFVYDLSEEHRPITLVFATSRTVDGIKDALVNKRTAVYFNDTIIGERKYLAPIFRNSIELKGEPVGLRNHEVKQLQIHNNSDITYHLKIRQPSSGFSGPDEIILQAHRTVAVELTGTSDEVASISTLKMYYDVENLISLKGEKLTINIDIPNK